MTCPHCAGDITRQIRAAIKADRSKTASKGGSVTGPSKRRNVDYAALARASHVARRLIERERE